MKKLFIWCAALGFLLNGCSIPGSSVTSTPLDISGVESSPVPPTGTKSIPPTLTAAIIPSDTPMPSVTPFAPFTASVWADNVNVRTNPGSLFPSKRQLTKNTPITILGKAPGGEWMYARVPDGIEGWVFAQLIQSDIDLQSVPIIEPKDVQLIKGHVIDSSGIPIQGVGFSIYKGTTDKPTVNHVLSDVEGYFYSFMPANATGDWLVVQDSIACASNVWTDDSCSYYKGSYKGQVEPQSITVKIPQTSALEFLWK